MYFFKMQVSYLYTLIENYPSLLPPPPTPQKKKTPKKYPPSI